MRSSSKDVPRLLNISRSQLRCGRVIRRDVAAGFIRVLVTNAEKCWRAIRLLDVRQVQARLLQLAKQLPAVEIVSDSSHRKQLHARAGAGLVKQHTEVVHDDV